jgi:CheY-like chemotaxis protein
MPPTEKRGFAAGCGSDGNADVTRAGPDSAPTDAAKRLLGVSVLLVEDNQVNQMVIEHMLATEGAVVVVAENGRVAVDRIADGAPVRFDVVLMDIQMPVMDGFEATRRIVELAPGLPIVAQTAHALPEELSKCLQAGMVEHLTKPIDHEKLVATILRFGTRSAAARG